MGMLILCMYTDTCIYQRRTKSITVGINEIREIDKQTFIKKTQK